jgi:TonB family protein
MRWAIAISIVLHMAALSLVFKGSRDRGKLYPANPMFVHLASPPPLQGIQNPAVEKPAEPEVKQAPKKVQKPPEETRVAEINPKKKPKREQPKEKPTPPKEDTPPQETQETKSKGLPEGVELGSEFGSARLDAVGFDSPTYLNILFGKIRNQWENPFETDQTIKCIIYFVVGREGRILDSAIETPSGIEAYDQAALRAVLATRPPPLPNQYESDELGIHLEFRYVPY